VDGEDAMDVVHHYDHRLIAEMRDPFPLLAAGRSECPVAHSDLHDGYWVLFTYEDVGQVARNPTTFSSSLGLGIPDHGFPLRLPPIETDPPLHIQYRGPLLEHFSPGAVARLEPQIRAIVTDLIDSFIDRGEADLATELTIPLPNIVIPRLFDLPAEDGSKFHDWAERLLGVTNDFDAALEMFGYFAAVFEDRIASPRDPSSDFPSMMLEIVIEGAPIAVDQAAGMMCTLVSAGVDTTANAGAHILDLMSSDPSLRDQLIAEPKLIPQAIEEFVRYISPVAAEARVTTSDTEIRGVPIAAGQRVTVNWIAANHDPAEFSEPDSLDLRRMPNRHYGFGAGPHRCLGAHLARLELRVLLEEVLQRIPDFKVDESRVERFSGVTRGIAHLPANFTPS
jgi:cytochrome P450